LPKNDTKNTIDKKVTYNLTILFTKALFFSIFTETVENCYEHKKRLFRPIAGLISMPGTRNLDMDRQER